MINAKPGTVNRRNRRVIAEIGKTNQNLTTDFTDHTDDWDFQNPGVESRKSENN
jgi:hypothetical protein